MANSNNNDIMSRPVVTAQLTTVNSFSKFKLNVLYGRSSRKIVMILVCGLGGRIGSRSRKPREHGHSETFFHLFSINGKGLAGA